MGDAVQVLITSYGSNHVQVTGTRKVLDLFENKKVAYVQVDGSSDVDTRNQLWEKSGKRSYPQVFIKGEYVGDHEYLQVRAAPAQERPVPAPRLHTGRPLPHRLTRAHARSPARRSSSILRHSTKSSKSTWFNKNEGGEFERCSWAHCDTRAA